ncbi:unnamed protein product [Heligmosomoides polygyrus]|uniref:Myosin motor domain-containing protein n=1 Tax=Heligmosomoides polygyrus TaxID=6339 RepID=A0A3P8ILW0_HELPZ|nr:unnamed protein product [Heligmosomoides polygyrus]
MGVISMLDEECIVPKASDLTLASKLNDQHLGKHPNFQKPRPPKGKQAEAHLAIVHYAGTVRYNDPLNDTAVTVLKANTGNQLMSELWADYNTQEDIVNMGKKAASGKKKGKSASFMTVSMMYRESLNKLMHMLNQTHPHFIRCIIPNEQKKSGRYAVLAADAAKSGKTEKEIGEKIAAVLINKGSIKKEEFQCGLTKVTASISSQQALMSLIALLPSRRALFKPLDLFLIL